MTALMPEFTQTKTAPTENVSVEGTMQSTDKTRMSVSADGAAHIMSVLTNLYSNPNLAVLREYSANALDSHKAAGSTEPIEVLLPSAYRPQFKVTDHGVGMSAEDIRNIYSVFGASTKRDDFKQVGAFGLGCKAALTLTQTFNLVAIKDGRKTVVDVSRGEDGVGVVSILAETDTDEPNGVSVTVPIPDYRRFNENVQNFFLTWEPGSVTVDGAEPKSIHDGSYFSHPDGLYRVKAVAGGWDSKPAIRVVMGGVAYTVDRYEVTSYGVGNCDVYVEIPIGAIDLTPSREGIRYSDRTKKYLNDLVSMIVSTLPETMTLALEGKKTKEEALKFISDHFTLFRDGLHRKQITWNGQVIPNNIDLLPENSSLRFSVLGHFTYDEAGNRIYTATLNTMKDVSLTFSINNISHYLTETKDLYIFCKVDDFDSLSSYKRNLIKNYLLSKREEDTSKHVYLYVHKDNLIKSEWMGDFGTSVKLDDILTIGKEFKKDHPPVTRQSAGTGEKLTYESVILTFDKTTKEPTFERKYLSVDDLKSHNTYYFDVNSKFLDTIREYSLNNTNSQHAQLEIVGLLDLMDMRKDTTFVYMLKSRKPEALEARLGRGITKFDTILFDFHAKLVQHLSEDDRIAVDVYNTYYSNSTVLQLLKHFATSDVKDPQLKSFAIKFKDWVDTGAKYARLNQVGLRIPLGNRSDAATQLLLSLDKRYPILQLNDAYYYRSQFLNHLDHAVIYVNAVYETTKKDK